MSKILKNTTGSPIVISDTGVTVDNVVNYTIPATDYLLWAASDNIITEIGSGDIVVNDGSSDLSISDGTDLIKGIFPNPVSVINTSTTPLTVNYPDSTTSAFGDLKVSQIDPYIIMDPFKTVSDRKIETFTSGTGSSAGVLDNAPGKEFEVDCGTSIGGFGVLRSRKTLSYRPGIGSLGRFTARFSTPVANSIQRAGFFNIGNELTFGHDGNNGFGILRKTGDRPELRKLTITTSSNQNTNLTITLNGTNHVVAITNGSIEENAFEIVDGYDWVANGWSAYNIDDTVVFQARSTGAKSGTYSTSASGNFAASFSQLQAGDTATLSWIYQANWNRTTLSTANDPFILDPTKGNVFQIQFQYLGYGALRFFIEDPSTGRFILVHMIEYANANVAPSIDLPTFKLGIISASAGSTTSLKVQSASLAGFHEDAAIPIEIVSSFRGEQSGVGTTLTNIVAIKKTTIAGDALDIRDILLNEITAASEGTKPVIFDMVLNPTFENPTEWESVNSNTSIVATSTGGTVTGGELLYSVGLSKSSNTFIDLSALNIILSNDDVVALAARATSGNTDIVATLVWGDR